jgi:hypothetical protein
MHVEDSSQSVLIQGVAAGSAETQTGSTGETIGAFDEILSKILKPNSANKVNEEELFAGIIEERTSTLKGEEASKTYHDKLDEYMASMQRADGYIPVEDAARKALGDMVDLGVLSQEESEMVHAQSFRAAQLDNNLNALYDGRGSAGDPTIALASMDSALLGAKTVINKLEVGEEIDDSNSDDGSTIGDEIGGDTGFVFKPVSEKDGNLAILFPPSFTDQIEDIFLKDKEGNEIEVGNAQGPTNGNRETFRFQKPGAEYLKNIMVEVLLKNGSIMQYEILNSSERYENLAAEATA